jgi:osmotically-inducible protein OsmY
MTALASIATRDAAEQIARDTDGVTDVVNKLQINASNTSPQ